MELITNVRQITTSVVEHITIINNTINIRLSNIAVYPNGILEISKASSINSVIIQMDVTVITSASVSELKR